MTAGQVPEPSELTCASCNRAIADTYYEVSGHVTCEDCRIVAEEQFNLGAGMAPLVRATLLGLLAAAAGFGMYYGVARLTGSEYGIVAALIGLMVGAAVKRGAHARGGWRFQALAMFLTYSAIVASYVPFLYDELMRAAQAPVPAHVTVRADSAATPPDTVAPPSGELAAQPDPSAPTDSAPPATPDATAPAAEASSSELGGLILGALALVAFIYAVPFLSGIENIIGLVIIGIALFEAWYLNRRGALTITGPHQVGAT